MNLKLTHIRYMAGLLIVLFLFIVPLRTEAEEIPSPPHSGEASIPLRFSIITRTLAENSITGPIPRSTPHPEETPSHSSETAEPPEPQEQAGENGQAERDDAIEQVAPAPSVEQTEPVDTPPDNETVSRFRFSLDKQATILWTFINDRITGSQYTLNTNRLRFDGRAFYGTRLSARAIYDLEARTGNLVSSPFWADIREPQAGSYWNLSRGYHPARAVELRHSLYRLYTTYDAGFATFTAGKQRIAWGVMRFWRPTDILNTESPLQVEPGEIVGIDALHVRSNLSTRSSLEYVHAPSRRIDGRTNIARISIPSGTYDFTLLGGKVRNHDTLGASFEGYIGDGGFRGEIIRLSPPPGFGTPYYQWSIGGDYTFDKLSLTAEYLYNGGALGLPAEQLFQPPTGFLTTRNKQFIGLNATYQVTPLIIVSAFASYDLQGPSYAFTPRITWNAAENIDISAGTILFKSSPQGEYATSPNIIFTQIRYFF